SDEEITFAQTFVSQNLTIPLIVTTETGEIFDYKNIDSARVKNFERHLRKKLDEFKEQHPPIVADYGIGKNLIYYGESFLLTQLRFYPYVQLTIIFLFLFVVLIALSA